MSHGRILSTLLVLAFALGLSADNKVEAAAITPHIVQSTESINGFAVVPSTGQVEDFFLTWTYDSTSLISMTLEIGTETRSIFPGAAIIQRYMDGSWWVWVDDSISSGGIERIQIQTWVDPLNHGQGLLTFDGVFPDPFQLFY